MSHASPSVSAPPNPGAATSSTSSKSSSALPKILLGCGCGVLAIGAIIVAVMVFGTTFFAKKVYDENKGKITEAKKMYDDAKEASERQRALDKKLRAKGLDPNATSIGRIDRDTISEWLGEPMESGGLAKHIAFMEEWSETESYTKYRALFADLVDAQEAEPGAEEATPGASPEEGLKGMRQARKLQGFFLGATEAYKEFELIATDHGGGAAVLRRYLQATALVVAADHIAQENLAGSDTAQQMLATHTEAQTAYGEWRTAVEHFHDLTTSLQANPDATKTPEYQEQARSYAESQEVLQDRSGLLVLGKLPRASVVQWSELSEKERGAIAQSVRDVPFLPLFLFTPKKVRELDFIGRQLLLIDMADITVSGESAPNPGANGTTQP